MTYAPASFVNPAAYAGPLATAALVLMICRVAALSPGTSLSSIRDLARHLNISIGTVSRALNGRADVNAETRERVLAAAAKLNYSPNQSGRNLRRGATHAVAFMLQPHPGDQQYGEPFFIPFLIGLAGGARREGARPHGGDGRARRLSAGAAAPRRRGALGRRRRARLDAAQGRPHRLPDEVGFPFATLGRSQSGGATYPSLDLDFEKAGAEAVDRLVARGHRRIAAVRPSLNLNFGHLFLDGYRKALRKHGIEPDAAADRRRHDQRGGRLCGYAGDHEGENPADRDHLQQRRNGARRLQGAGRDGPRAWQGRGGNCHRRYPALPLFHADAHELPPRPGAARPPPRRDAARFAARLRRTEGRARHQRSLADGTGAARQRARPGPHRLSTTSPHGARRRHPLHDQRMSCF